jgi:hypothetical protein
MFPAVPGEQFAVKEEQICYACIVFPMFKGLRTLFVVVLRRPPRFPAVLRSHRSVGGARCLHQSYGPCIL